MTKAKAPKTKLTGECEFTFGDGKLPFTLDLTERKKKLMKVLGKDAATLAKKQLKERGIDPERFVETGEGLTFNKGRQDGKP